MEMMCCKTQKAVKLMKELDTENGIGLIEKKRPGLGRPNVIYVKKFMVKEIGEMEKADQQIEGSPDRGKMDDYEDVQASALKEQETVDSQGLGCGLDEAAYPQEAQWEPEDIVREQDAGNQKSRILKIKNQEFPKSKFRDFENQNSGVLIIKNQEFPESKVRNCENQNRGVLKIKIQEFPKSKSNNTDFSNTDLSDTDPIHPDQIGSPGASVLPMDVIEEMDLYRETIREKISYEHFADGRNHLREKVDELVELVVDVMMMPDNNTLRIAGVERPVAVVKNRFIILTGKKFAT